MSGLGIGVLGCVGILLLVVYGYGDSIVVGRIMCLLFYMDSKFVVLVTRHSVRVSLLVMLMLLVNARPNFMVFLGW